MEPRTTESWLASKVMASFFVAANHWPRAWYKQALENPSVQVTVDGGKRTYLAVPRNR